MSYIKRETYIDELFNLKKQFAYATENDEYPKANGMYQGLGTAIDLAHHMEGADVVSRKQVLKDLNEILRKADEHLWFLDAVMQDKNSSAYISQTNAVKMFKKWVIQCRGGYESEAEKSKKTESKPRVSRKGKRKYYRKCGICGERHEQSEMVRTVESPNGWLCFDCHNAKHPENDIEEW